jgi:serine/threonine protein kinase
LVAAGAFGEVRVCQRLTDLPLQAGAQPEFVAKKVMHSGPDSNEGQKRKQVVARRRNLLIQREADILSEIMTELPPHPNIVTMVDLDMNQEYALFVFKYEAHGTLHAVFHEDIQRPLHDTETAYVSCQLLQAVSFLHHYSILHRDLKLENILVADAVETPLRGWLLSVKVTDFGLSRIGDWSNKSHVGTLDVGTLNYMAPEMVGDGDRPGCGVDNWSLGVTLYYLLTSHFPGSRPYMTSQETLDAKICADLAASLQPVVHGLLRKDQKARISAQQALVIVHEGFPWLHAVGNVSGDNTCGSSCASHSPICLKDRLQATDEVTRIKAGFATRYIRKVIVPECLLAMVPSECENYKLPNATGAFTNCKGPFVQCLRCKRMFCKYHHKVNMNDGWCSFGGHVCEFGFPDGGVI